MTRLQALVRSPMAVAGLMLGIAAVGLLSVVLMGRPNATPAPSGIGGPFALIDQNGKSVTQADFIGRPFLVFFGYTHCPDVCPTTLNDMSQMLNSLGKDEPVSALFITVDPERDTAPELKDYLSSFDPRIVGLTGNQAAITAVEKAYRVYSKKVPTSGGDYSMDHTAIVYLMDKQGRFVNALNLEQKPEAAAAEFRHDL